MEEEEVKDRYSYEISCRLCHHRFTLFINYDDLYEWHSFEKLVQDAFPYLTVWERELLISHTCKKCFLELWPEESK